MINDVSILVVILATTPYWLWSARIHNVIAIAMSICVAVGNKVMDYPDCLSLLGVPLKNDVESGVIKNVSGKCCIIVQSAITFVVILATTPNWLWSARIHNAIAAAMSMCVAEGNKVMDSPVCLSL